MTLHLGPPRTEGLAESPTLHRQAYRRCAERERADAHQRGPPPGGLCCVLSAGESAYLTYGFMGIMLTYLVWTRSGRDDVMHVRVSIKQSLYSPK